MENLLNDVTQRMDKSLSALRSAFNKIRTGRANPAILDDVNVDYYGNMTPINQTSNISIEEGRSIVLSLIHISSPRDGLLSRMPSSA